MGTYLLSPDNERGSIENCGNFEQEKTFLRGTRIVVSENDIRSHTEYNNSWRTRDETIGKGRSVGDLKQQSEEGRIPLQD